MGQVPSYACMCITWWGAHGGGRSSDIQDRTPRGLGGARWGWVRMTLRFLVGNSMDGPIPWDRGPGGGCGKVQDTLGLGQLCRLQLTASTEQMSAK